jgi:hypothetical protein
MLSIVNYRNKAVNKAILMRTARRFAPQDPGNYFAGRPNL